MDSRLRAYLPLIRRIARRQIARLPASVEMDDMVQAGLIGAWGLLQREDEPLDAYLSARIRGAMLDELRRTDPLSRHGRDRQQADSLTFEPLGSHDCVDPALGPEERLSAQQMVTAALAAFERLPARVQRALVLYYESGLPMAEIGAELGVTESRVSQMLDGAIRALA